MRLLIADDDPVSRRLLARTVEEMGHEVIAVQDGFEAWTVLQQESIHLVIADWMMPEMDGLELVRRIRATTRDRYIYVILLTSRNERRDVIDGLAAGADDYIVKPFDREELLFRIRSGERVVRLEEALAERNRQLAMMALVDGLTGIGNRRSFDEQFHRTFSQSVRYHNPLSIVMVDIDHFKRYNDSLGHEAGDEALRRVARCLAAGIRASDAAFRYGGEEFVVLLPETHQDGARGVARRLVELVRREGIPHPENPPRGVVTISAGVSTYVPGTIVTENELLKAADDALYEAKREGRDRVVAATLPSAAPA